MLFRRLRSSRGQVIVVYSIALPALLAMAALALDGGKLIVHRLHLQNAVDAASLAAVQELGPGNCFEGPASPICDQAAAFANVKHAVNCFARDNNAPAGNCGGGPFPVMEACLAAWDTETSDQRKADNNCFTWPYVKGGVPNWGKVEVRLRKTVSLSFGKLPGIPSTAYPSARAVAAYNPLIQPGLPGQPGATLSVPASTAAGTVYTATTVIGGSTVVVTSTVPGGTHTSTNVTFGDCDGGGDCGVAFAMSTACPAITYSGNGGTTIGSLETNGGFQVTGNAPKHIHALYLGKLGTPGCYDNKGVADFDRAPVGPFSPQNWPIPPPNIPTPVPLGQALSGNQCWSVTSPAQATTPGVYCNLNGTINFSGQIRKGYTWFARCIIVSGNSGDTEYYTGIPASEGGRQQTLFYASGTDADCGGAAAITIQGQSNVLVGDIFAPSGTISMQGGGVQGGSGFLEADKLKFAGTFPNYTGTGPKQGGSVVVVTTTDPSTTVLSTTTGPGSTSGYITTSDPITYPSTTIILPPTPSTPDVTIGTTIGLGE